MSEKISSTVGRVQRLYREACINASASAVKHSSLMLFAAGIVLLNVGLSEMASAQGGGAASAKAVAACANLLQYLEGGFGALLAAAAGIGAVVAAAVGGFKAAWCLLVVSIGAFILRAYITLFNAGC